MAKCLQLGQNEDTLQLQIFSNALVDISGITSTRCSAELLDDTNIVPRGGTTRHQSSNDSSNSIARFLCAHYQDLNVLANPINCLNCLIRLTINVVYLTVII